MSAVITRVQAGVITVNTLGRLRDRALFADRLTGRVRPPPIHPPSAEFRLGEYHDLGNPFP